MFTSRGIVPGAICFFTALALAPAVGRAVELGPWSGGVTTDSAVVKVKMAAAGTGAELLVSTSLDLSNPMVFPQAPAPDSLIAAFQLGGLTPGTQYYYAVRNDGFLFDQPDQRGRFQTFDAAPASFSFVFGSCARTGSNHPVFDAIAAHDPLFFMNVGDLHYEDINVNDPARFRSAYDLVLGSPRQSALYRGTPLVHIWDDHDYGPNDSDRLAPGRESARLVYREYVPHYNLAMPQANAPIDQAFTVGNARFILSDLRSERDPKGWTDGPDKRMMNTDQMLWFQNQVLEAKANDQIIFWVSSVPWISAPAAGADHWGGYTHQRREIANFLADNDIDNLVILAGDAHMIAADDGSNANFSDDPDAPLIRVLQSGALDRAGSVKGGLYSGGTFPNSSVEGLHGQYALVTVTDLGHEALIEFIGYRVDNLGVESELMSMSFVVPIPEPAALGLVGFAAMALLRRQRSPLRERKPSCP